MKIIRDNPAWFMGIVTALVAAIINGLILWGVSITIEQAAWLNGIVLIVVPLILSLWAQAPITAMLARAKAEGVAEGLAAKHD